MLPLVSTNTTHSALTNVCAKLWPLLVATGDKYRTLPLGVALFESSYGTNYPQLMAVAFLAMLPVLISQLVRR